MQEINFLDYFDNCVWLKVNNESCVFNDLKNSIGIEKKMYLKILLNSDL